MKALKRLNEALPMLAGTILIYGVILQVTAIWFFEDKIRYTTGLWIGIACAEFMAIHLAIVLRDAVDMGGGNGKLMAAKSVLRYIVVVAVFFITAYFKLGNIISAFIGVMGLKICAYAQPLIQKILNKGERGKE
ncbi:MAG: hypothetical protein K6A69_01710 [Lachnospiraceae bacterium]|nr:hypothetical protein [Lachnospiraceae bacterium]